MDDSDDIELVKAAVKKHGMDYPCLLDHEFAWAKSAGFTGIPAFMLVDGAGKVSTIYRGKLKKGSEAYNKLARGIEALLAK